MSPWWLLSAPAAVGLLVLSHAFAYWRGTKAGFKEGYQRGTAKRLSIDEFLELLRRADHEAWDAHSDVLPDLSGRREVN